MKLNLLMLCAVAVCLLSLAARSWAMHAAPQASPTVKAVPPHEQVALAAIDGHLRAKLVKMARR